MAGGIFTNEPFQFNEKCVLFGLVAMAAYWLLPCRNIYLLPIIFIVVYIMIAWYDWVYECNDRLLSGKWFSALTGSIFKPQRRSEGGTNLAVNQERRYMLSVYIFHLIAVVPLLLYVGMYKQAVDIRVYDAVLAMGVLAGAYHGMRLFLPRETL